MSVHTTYPPGTGPVINHGEGKGLQIKTVKLRV